MAAAAKPTIAYLSLCCLLMHLSDSTVGRPKDSALVSVCLCGSAPTPSALMVWSRIGLLIHINNVKSRSSRALWHPRQTHFLCSSLLQLYVVVVVVGMSSKFFTWTKGDRSRNAPDSLFSGAVVPIPVECIHIKGFDYSRTPKARMLPFRDVVFIILTVRRAAIVDHYL